MRSQNVEALSAMLDNEADEMEVRRVLRESGQDPTLAAAWERMCLVQAALHDDNLSRGGRVPLINSRLSAAVMDAIAAETPVSPGLPAFGRWGLSLAKLGIAASVAMAFFLGMQVSLTDQTSEPAVPSMARQEPRDQSSAVNLPVATAVTTARSEPTTVESVQRQVDPAARLRLEEYIRSASITREKPPGLEQLEDSPLYRLVNEIQDRQ